MKPEDLAYLHHILDAIANIEDFSKDIASAAELTDSSLKPGRQNPPRPHGYTRELDARTQ